MAARDVATLSGVELAIAVALALGWRWEQDEDGQRVLVGPDRVVGRQVWQCCYYPDRHTLGDPHSLPDYPGDIAAAWTLVEDAQQRGYRFQLRTPGVRSHFVATFIPRDQDFMSGHPSYWAWADTPATAICRAWLKLIAEVADGRD